MKTCSKCQVSKPLDQFYPLQRGSIKLKASCKQCMNIRRKAHLSTPRGRELKRQAEKAWRSKPENKPKIAKRNGDYNRAHKEEIRKGKNRLCKEKRKTDPAWRLRRDINRAIHYCLQENGSTKEGSFLKHLPYTMQELKDYIEKQFEPWMNWGNQGYYLPTEWDDANSSTWRWQLDHVIPQSRLQYRSMKEENFLKCWALENLRPYSAKKNCLDGARRQSQ